MNKKEISEIKRLFTKEHCRIDHLCGCYIDAEKNKRLQFREAFYSLPEEETHKYFEIFRKALSGSLGKNLLTMEFPLSEEKEGGHQEFLLNLRDSNLESDELLNRYYDLVTETCTCTENYLILLIDGRYDIPAKTSDDIELIDASEYVYHYLLSVICPVCLSKPGLCYNAQGNCIEERIRDWIVETPELGFLFPVFHDRNTDIHSLLFYSKNAALPNADIASTLLGCSLPLPAKEQQETFNTLVEEVLGSECSFEAVRSIHENLSELLEEEKNIPEPSTLDARDIKRLLSACGAPDENLSTIDSRLANAMGEKQEWIATNITNTRRFEVKTPNITIHVKPDRTDLIETRILDGNTYLVIPLTDEVMVNGVHVVTSPIVSSSSCEDGYCDGSPYDDFS